MEALSADLYDVIHLVATTGRDYESLCDELLGEIGDKTTVQHLRRLHQIAAVFGHVSLEMMCILKNQSVQFFLQSNLLSKYLEGQDQNLYFLSEVLISEVYSLTKILY